MKQKLPSSTIFLIAVFSAIAFILILGIAWQIQTIRKTQDTIILTKKRIEKKQKDIDMLQSQLDTLRKIQASYKQYLESMQKEFNMADSNRKNLMSFASFPPKNATYKEPLTKLPEDLKSALTKTNVKNLKIYIEESNNQGFVQGTIKAYGTLQELYNLKIQLLGLDYIDSIKSSLIQKIANQKYITLKFWIRTL